MTIMRKMGSRLALIYSLPCWHNKVFDPKNSPPMLSFGYRGVKLSVGGDHLPINRSGIVNLTRVWQTGPHEQANTQLPTSPFSRIVKQLIQPCGIEKA